MSLPDLTHQQFLILEKLLKKGSLTGRQLRSAIAKDGVRKNGPAFYQFMARLEESGWVRGWYEQKVIDGQIIKERHYEVLGRGAIAYDKTRQFYLDRGIEPEGGLIVA